MNVFSYQSVVVDIANEKCIYTFEHGWNTGQAGRLRVQRMQHRCKYTTDSQEFKHVQDLLYICLTCLC